MKERFDALDLLPSRVKPMLPMEVENPFDRKRWVFEVKFDGLRAMARKSKSGNPDIYSRDLKALDFPSIRDSLNEIDHQIVLDGEIVAIGLSGKSDFTSLIRGRYGVGGLAYYVFDIPYLDGESLAQLPLINRKKILEKILPHLPNVFYMEHVLEHGIALFEEIKKQGLEGMMAKNGQSIYEPGDMNRSRNWLKIKNNRRKDTSQIISKVA